MKLCFPVENDEGMQSKVYGHFGSAPAFVICDTDSATITATVNKDKDHVHGQCNPVGALGGHVVDAVIVGGIGAGALNKLNQMGIKVLRASGTTISENIALFKSESLQELTVQHTCSGHSHGGGCAH